MKDTQWFRNARFGMFIHWGLYALPGGIWKGEEMSYIGEWIQSKFRIPNAEYGELAQQFNPVNFNADEWIGTAAKAGVRYLVYTTKHHDGFAMYHSKVNPYNIYDATPFKRDPLKELAEACEKYNVKLGIYYSHHLDWHEPNGGDPGPEHPKNASNMSWGNDWDYPDWSHKDFNEYFESKVIPQIHELFTNYGRIHTLWCDCPLTMKPEFSKRLCAYVNSLQPWCLINSRIGNNCGDYGSLGDNQQPTAYSDYPLESPVTLNRTWGFKWNDKAWKAPETAARELVALASRNSNYLLNIGPQPDGRFPQGAMDFFTQLTPWMDEVTDAIHDCQPNPFPSELPFGWCTRRGNRLNLFIRDWQDTLELNGVRNQAVAASVPFEQTATGIVLHLGKRPESLLPLVTIDLDGEPDISSELIPQNGTLTLLPGKGKLTHGVDTTQKHSVLDRTGTLAQWENPEDSIEWAVTFPQGGTYELLIDTQARAWWSDGWKGGRRVEIQLGENVFDTELTCQTETKEAYRHSALSHIGIATVPDGWTGRLSMRTSAVMDPQCVNVNLVSVLAKRIER